MSFPRHERSIVRWDYKPGADQEPVPLPTSHRLDESPLVIPWQVALLQSPPPLHQPAPSSRQPAGNVNLPRHQVAEFSTGEMGKFQTVLTRRPGVVDCSAIMRRGYPVPDPRCTPGGIDPSVTAEVLRNRAWRTRCIRNCQTSEAEKHITYRWYGMRVPRRNHGESQVCELDHLVPLELGGADGLGNIWPECGPSAVALDKRYFKIKDRVENYLAGEVRSGRMPLATAQRGIATDWTQYLDAANRYCAAGGRCH